MAILCVTRKIVKILPQRNPNKLLLLFFYFVLLPFFFTNHAYYHHKHVKITERNDITVSDAFVLTKQLN